MITNVMSVDLEDYFCDLPFSMWEKYQSRIIDSTNVLLDTFEKHNVNATFFTLGYIAEKFPDLIKKIHDKGHEIASHSYSHPDLRKISKDDFEKDFLKSLHIIEKITGEKVLGFRAPYFSVDKSNFWVFDILRKYIKYDSSVFPVKTPLYGLSGAPREVYHPSMEDITREDSSESFISFPLLIYRVLSCCNLPVAGGFYFRFLPYFLIKKGLNKFSKNKKPAMFYIHPKDLDKNMPKVETYSWHYYYGKRNILQKFQTLLKEFKFTTAKEVLKI